jgi:hypothetical protein
MIDREPEGFCLECGSHLILDPEGNSVCAKCSQIKNKFNSGQCVWPGCDTPLIVINDFQMCSTHTKMLRRQLYQFRKKREKKGKKMGGTNVIMKNHILNQVRPIGVPLED